MSKYLVFIINMLYYQHLCVLHRQQHATLNTSQVRHTIFYLYCTKLLVDNKHQIVPHIYTLLRELIEFWFTQIQTQTFELISDMRVQKKNTQSLCSNSIVYCDRQFIQNKGQIFNVIYRQHLQRKRHQQIRDVVADVSTEGFKRTIQVMKEKVSSNCYIQKEFLVYKTKHHNVSTDHPYNAQFSPNRT